MKLSSDQPLALEIHDPEIREHTVESQIKIGIPFQIRAIREKRGWTQEEVAQKLGTTQNTISRLENPRTGKPTIKTLLRLAHAYDVGLLVRFVPFGFYGDVINAMDATHVEIPSYDEELAEEQKQDAAIQETVNAKANNTDTTFVCSTTVIQHPVSGKVITSGDYRTQMRIFDNVIEIPKMKPSPSPSPGGSQTSFEASVTEPRTTIYARTR